MKNSDTIEIKINKKDKIYLAIIAFIIIVATLVCIFVPRYYKLKYSAENSSGKPSTSMQNNSSNNWNSPITKSQMQNSCLNKVVVLLAGSGDMFKSFKNYLTGDNLVNANMLSLTSFDFSQLEELANPIFALLTPLVKDGKVNQADIILNDELVTKINHFKDYLNNLYFKANNK